MKRLTFSLIILLCFVLIALPNSLTYAIPARIIKSLPSPERPMGLTFDGSYLWNGDWVTRKIYQRDPSSGDVISSIHAGQSYGPTGLAFDGKYLWQATTGFLSIDKGYIYKIDPSNGRVIYSFQTPQNDPCGLTYDGTYLWLADNSPNAETIYQLDTFGNVITSFPIPQFLGERRYTPQDLAFDGKYLWFIEYNRSAIFQLDPYNGKIISSLELPYIMSPHRELRGLTWDGSYLWVSDSNYCSINQIGQIPESSTIILMSCGLLGLLGIVIRQRRREK